MAKARAVIIGAGRRHNAPLIAALTSAGLDVTLLARLGDIVRDEELARQPKLYRLDVGNLASLIPHIIDNGLQAPSILICDSGFAHDELIDAHDLARIDHRITEVQSSAMAAGCASVALARHPGSLFVMLGFVSAFRHHPGYRRFARGARAGFDVAQALADSEAGFKVAYIGLDGEDPRTDHPGLGQFILKLWRNGSRLSRWLYEVEDLDDTRTPI